VDQVVVEQELLEIQLHQDLLQQEQIILEVVEVERLEMFLELVMEQLVVLELLL